MSGHPSSPAPPQPALPLEYASADEFGLVRPLLWLVIVMPIGTTLFDLSRYAAWAYAVFTSGPVSGVSTGDWFGLLLVAAKLVVNTAVVLLTVGALRDRRFGLLPAACVLMAMAGVGVGLVGTLISVVQLRQSQSWPAWVFWQTTISGVVASFASAILPTTAYFALRFVRRRLPGM